MFDTRAVNKEFFQVKLYKTNDETDEIEKEIVVSIGCPKLKTLKKIMSLGKGLKEGEEDDSLFEAVRLILNKNKEKVKVDDDFIGDLEYTEMIDLYNAFFKWLNDNHKSKN